MKPRTAVSVHSKELLMKKLTVAVVALAGLGASVPAMASTPTATTMLSNVNFSDAISGVFAAGGLIAGLIVAGTGVKWALRFLRG